MRGCRRLRTLSLAGLSLTSVHLCWCSQLTEAKLHGGQLRQLYLYGCLRLRQADTRGCGSLRVLELQKCKALQDADLAALLEVWARHQERTGK